MAFKKPTLKTVQSEGTNVLGLGAGAMVSRGIAGFLQDKFPDKAHWVNLGLAAVALVGAASVQKDGFLKQSMVGAATVQALEGVSTMVGRTSFGQELASSADTTKRVASKALGLGCPSCGGGAYNYPGIAYPSVPSTILPTYDQPVVTQNPYGDAA